MNTMQRAFELLFSQPEYVKYNMNREALENLLEADGLDTYLSDEEANRIINAAKFYLNHKTVDDAFDKASESLTFEVGDSVHTPEGEGLVAEICAEWFVVHFEDGNVGEYMFYAVR